MKPSNLRQTGLALAFGLLGAQPATANFVFSGNLAADDSVQFFTFTLSTPSHVIIGTSSFTGGGFLPAVALWDSAGLSGGGQLGGNGGAPGEVYWDIDLSSNSAGAYWLALSEFPNVAGDNDLVFSGGVPGTAIFQYDGQGNYTGLVSTGYCSADRTDGFYMAGAADCVQRSNAWGLSIDGQGVTSAGLFPQVSVPAPATLALTLAGLAGFIPGARRRSVGKGRPRLT